MQKIDFKCMGKIENLIAIQIATNILNAYYVVNFHRKNQIKILISEDHFSLVRYVSKASRFAIDYLAYYLITLD